ncbi:MAG TPA: PIG-L deacetylase family protein [Acidimicrobiia bacterium]|nr:PIG-L deacetylase family protein [Acidimicrobiia bacterium]
MTNLYDDLRPRPGPLPTPASALTIGAHPDDAEFGAGGTLARWVRDGCELTMLVVTDGSKGSWDEAMSISELVSKRREEQRRAAEVIGASEVIHLDHIDGELEHSMALREEMCRWIRTVQPTIVLGHDPWRRYMLHPDHRAAGLGLIDGVVAARDHLFFPDQGLEKHRPEAILLWQADEPNHYEDIGGTFDVKIAALLEHSSQAQTTMGDAAASDEARAEFVDRMRRLAAETGRAAGLELAESFRLIRP